MTSPADSLIEFLKIAGSLSILTGAMAKWWQRAGSFEEDEVISSAARELIEGISDGDLVNKVKEEMDINLRDQITVEQIEDWARDRDLRGYRNRN